MDERPEYSEMFEGQAGFDPSEAFEDFLARIPAKGAVYLLADEADRPVQLLAVGNLRQSLKRRLGGQEQIGPSKRVNYRDLVRRIHWRRVDSRFEADAVYYRIAQRLYPESYRGMLGLQSAWFVHVNPQTQFPRYMKTSNLTLRSGMLFGPMEDKHAAARWIEVVEDCFDLCRFYHILTQAPEGMACAYKGMGKCPAPCDGSISMEAYRQQMQFSTRVGFELPLLVEQQSRRMAEAAGELRFESAGKIKSHVEQLERLRDRPFRFVRPLADFRYVSLQRGPRAGTAKVFLISRGAIEEFAGVIGEGKLASDLLREILTRFEAGVTEQRDSSDQNIGEWISIVVNHLFAAKRSSGVFLHLSELNDRSMAKALADLRKQKVADELEDEGLINELQTL